VSNATTSTLQGLTRGGGTRRYGFEFTIPIHMGRFTSSPEAPTPSTARAPAAEPAPTPPSAPAPSAVPIPAQAPPSGAAPTPVPAKPSPVDTAALNPQPGRGAVAIAAPVPAITSARTSAPRPSVHTTKKVITARMKGQAYLPAHMEISTGTTVTWKNLDALIHTVTAVDNSFNSGVIVADGSYSHTFAKPGTYQVYCVAHPFMKATIVVK
jgi:plastocyanin